MNALPLGFMVEISCTALPKRKGFMKTFKHEWNGFHIQVSGSFDVRLSDKYPCLIELLLPGNHSTWMRLMADSAQQIFSLQRSTGLGFPVYFHVKPDGSFVAATHIQMLRTAGVRISEDADVLAEYLLYRFVMPPRTYFKGIERMHHGGTLRLSLSGESCRILSNEPLPFSNDDDSVSANCGFRGRTMKLAESLRDSVASVSSSDGGTRVLMSGGIDSTMTALLARNELGVSRTYSTAYPFEDPAMDMERQYATSAANALGFGHRHYVGASEDYLRSIIISTASAEEPIHHLQTPCMHMLFDAGIDDGARVIQGLGAGGVFGNFRNFLYYRDKPVYRLLTQPVLMAAIKLIMQSTGRGEVLYSKLRDMRNDAPISKAGYPLWHWHLYGNPDWVEARFGQSLQNVMTPHLELLQGTLPKTVYDMWAGYSLFGDEDVTLSINTKVAAGAEIELHSPLYADSVIQQALSMPWSEKMRAPENRLRKQMATIVGVPEFICKRRKTGFGVKRRDWASKNGMLEPLVPLCRDVIDIDELRQLQSESVDDVTSAMMVWCLLTYSIWKRLVVNQEPVEMLTHELALAKQD